MDRLGKSGESVEVCQECGSPMAWRQAHGYPVLLQVLFGVSFIAFLIFIERLKLRMELIWAWCIIQITLGVLLMRGRLRARHRVLRCIRCTADLR